MEAVVRRKLGLPENASICLAQLREGKPIDLEDGKEREFNRLALPFEHFRWRFRRVLFYRSFHIICARRSHSGSRYDV